MVFRGRPCSAPDCCNKKVKGNKNGIFFYTLPTDEKLSKKWLANLRIDKTIPRLYSKNYLVCWKHFEPDCFDRDFRVSQPAVQAQFATILDKMKWNSKPHPPQIKDEAARRAKTRHFPILDLGGGGGGGLGFAFTLSKIVGHVHEITLCRHQKVCKGGLRYGNKCLPWYVHIVVATVFDFMTEEEMATSHQPIWFGFLDPTSPFRILNYLPLDQCGYSLKTIQYTYTSNMY